MDDLPQVCSPPVISWKLGTLSSTYINGYPGALGEITEARQRTGTAEAVARTERGWKKLATLKSPKNYRAINQPIQTKKLVFC